MLDNDLAVFGGVVESELGREFRKVAVKFLNQIQNFQQSVIIQQLFYFKGKFRAIFVLAEVSLEDLA